jgi:hypothetical protein
MPLLVGRDPSDITLPEVLEVLEKATCLFVFCDREIHAFVDDHEQDNRYVYRLPPSRRYLSCQWLSGYDPVEHKWQNHLGYNTRTISSRKGSGLIDQWIDVLPGRDKYHPYKMVVYIRDHKGLRLDPDLL